jgi:hypothetical protein
LQTLPDEDPRMPAIKKKLRVICKEEEEHVAWGEKETRRILAENPRFKKAFYGLLELQMWLVPKAVQGLKQRAPDHPVLQKLDDFVAHVQKRVWAQGKALGFVPDEPASGAGRAWAVTRGMMLLGRSQFARSKSKLDKTYLEELGFKA